MSVIVYPFAQNSALALPDRVMPHSLEAEQSLLGILMANNRMLDRVVEFLQHTHFYAPVHGRIFHAICKTVDRGQVANHMTLKDYFAHDPDLVEAGGAQFLNDLVASIIMTANAEDHAKHIYECYLRRELVGIGEETALSAYKPEVGKIASHYIEQAEQKLYNLATLGESEKAFISLADGMNMAREFAEKASKRTSHVVGVTTGLRDLDKKLGGLHRSDLVILAGRPAMGKTALATNMAFNAAKAFAESNGRDGGKVAFFSLEMSSEQLASRVMADVASIASDKIRKGEVTQSDFLAFTRAAMQVQAVPLFIDDTAAMTLMGIRTRARRLKRQQGLDMIVIDYLQIMTGSGSNQASSNRVQEVSEMTRGLKNIAKELDVPILVLSQLSRSNEKREDKRPQLSDLRDSGSIEQDADVVLFVHREQYYLEREQPIFGADDSRDKFEKRMEAWQQRMQEVYNTAEVIVAKHRHGPTGIVNLMFDGQFTRFRDLDTTHAVSAH